MKYIIICIILIGCSATEKKYECSKKNQDSIACKATRKSINQTTFLATSIYYKQGKISIPTGKNNVLSEVLRFSKLYNSKIHLISNSKDDSSSVQKNRLKKLSNYFIKNNIPVENLKQKITKTPSYRNGKINTNLSRKIEIYLEY